jgi:hypothetical protein
MNQALGAQAFTHGSDIYYGAGKSPSVSDLTAHELTHVVQQTGTVQLQPNPGKSAQASGPTQADINRAMSELNQAKALVTNPDAPLLDDERSQLKASIATAEANLSAYIDKANQGSTQQAAMTPLLAAGGVVIGDDATVIGVADDWLLPVIGLGLLATYLFTRSPASNQELAQSWSQVTSSIKAAAAAGTGLIALKINGERIRGNTQRLAEHLARLLRLTNVGGVPSGEPPSPNNDNDPHWWTEIKAFLKNIATGMGDASRKQVMRELQKKFTEEQILEIERRLIEAAKKVGEDPPPFLPPR